MLPYLLVGGAYFAYCLYKERRERAEARAVFDQEPLDQEVEPDPQNEDKDGN